MPRQFKGARTKVLWLESRQKWRVTIILPDKARTTKHFADEKDARRYASAAAGALRRLDEVTFDKAIALYERERMLDKTRPERVVLETSRRLSEFFKPVIKSRLASLTDKRAKELYLGKTSGTHLLEHGLVGRPTLRRAKEEAPAPCKLPCKCEYDGPPLRPDSHRTYLAEAKTFMRWCVAKEFTGTNVVEGVTGIGRRNPGGLGRNQLSRTELRALYRKCVEMVDANDDERALGVLFALVFGFRASEICTRRVRDIDVETWTIEVDIEAAKTDASDRDNMIPEPLRPAIARRMEGRRPDSFLFGDGRTAHYRDWVSESLRVICVKARVRVVHAHSLRGAHEDLAKAAGQTSAAICAQLGHEEARTGDRSYTSDLGRRGARRAQQATVLEVLEGGKATGTDGGQE